MKIFKNHLASKCLAIVLSSLFLIFPSGVFAQDGAELEELDVSLGELLNLEVSVATKTAMALDEAPSIVSVITGDEIKNMGARDVRDALNTLPGILIGSHGQRIEIRGISTVYSEKVLLLIDGFRINNSLNGTGMRFLDLMVDNIKQIEIIRGPGSALYGANAFIAVINVITKSASDINGVQLTAGGGSFSTQHYSLLAGYQFDEFQISGHFDILDSNGAEYYIEKDALHGQPGGLSPGDTAWPEEKYDFGLKMKYHDLNFNLRGMAKRDYNEYVGVALALNDETHQDFDQLFGELAYTRAFTDNLDATVRLYAGYYKQDLYFEIFPENFTGQGDLGLIGNPVLKSRNAGGELSMNYAWASHMITGGFNYELIDQYEVRNINNFLNVFEEPVDTTDYYNWNRETDRKLWAFYIQDVWEITDSDSLTLGIRHDNYSDFGGTTNPRIGYVHEFKNEMTMKALYGSAFRAPTFAEMYTINNNVLRGSEDTKPETIQTAELGFNIPFLKNYAVNLNYFHNVIEDLITTGPSPAGGGPAPYINSSGETTIDGAEAQFDVRLSKSRYGYLNVSYQEGEDEDGRTLPFVPEWMVKMGMNTDITKYLNANMTVTWIGERPRAEGDTRDDLDGQTLVDLSLIAKNLFRNLEIRCSIHNLFDEDYRDPSPDLRVPNDFPYQKQMLMLEAKYTF